MVGTQNLVIPPVHGLQAMETGKYIHHMCGYGEERLVKTWVLNNKGKKKLPFLVNGYEPETNTVCHFDECHWHGNTCLKNFPKYNKRDIKIHVRFIGLSKIMDGIQNRILRQLGNVRNQYSKMYRLKRSLHLTLTF